MIVMLYLCMYLLITTSAMMACNSSVRTVTGACLHLQVKSEDRSPTRQGSGRQEARSSPHEDALAHSGDSVTPFHDALEDISACDAHTLPREQRCPHQFVECG